MADCYSGSWALVTGASSGIGAEFAKQLAARGTNLVLSARSEDKLHALARALSQQVETRVVVADLSDAAGASVLATGVDHLGVPVAHLVNNAGFGLVGSFVAGDPEVQARMVRLNCEALMLLSRHFLPAMIEARRGGIIHVASVAGHLPTPYMAVYGATKAFVLSFSLALAEEVRNEGVTVSALCPGPVPTGFQQAAGMKASKLPRLSAMSAEQTVTSGLHAYENGQTLCVPGALNSIQTWAAHLLPRSVVARGTAVAMRSMGRAR